MLICINFDPVIGKNGLYSAVAFCFGSALESGVATPVALRLRMEFDVTPQSNYHFRVTTRICRAMHTSEVAHDMECAGGDVSGIPRPIK